MKASEKAYSLIRQFEGLRLTAYRCPAGVWTIGYGHTSGVTEGMTISVEQAEDLLRQDIETAENGVLGAGAPRVFFKYYFVNSATGEKSGVMYADATWTSGE